VTLQKLGDLPGAAAAYQTAIGIDGSYLEAWLYQGRLAVRAGEPQKAVPLFQRARAINPRHSEVNTELAELEWNAGNPTEARRFAEDAIRSDPSNSRAHWFLAISADKLGDADAAVREFTAYLQTIGTGEKDNVQSVGWARTRLQQLKDRW
jgi:Tfp pilus assembly protein PilF